MSTGLRQNAKVLFDFKKYVKIFALIRCKITSCIIEQTVWAVERLCSVVFMPIPLIGFGLNCHEKNGSLLLVVLCLSIADKQIAKKEHNKIFFAEIWHFSWSLDKT